MKEEDNAATKKSLGTTGKDPQRKRTSLNEKEEEVILRGRTYRKKRTTLQRKKKRLGTAGKDPQRKRTSLNEKEGEAIKRKD